VVTGNIADFDFLNQLVPDRRILVYRRAENQRVPPRLLGHVP